ncbi:MAG TPA: UDP-2,3-diacylglucosamine hydrolase [Bacteroidales bacterium]|nr:UDP-2,3-diacylglucosamine hydrolase [Bacteroidales bacterium]
MIKQKRRKLDVLVISDVHLGTYGCKAKELLSYLKTVKPKILVLNGDIIDIWQFSKSYFPKSHLKVIKHLTNLLAKGTIIYYVTGNHDEMLRKFEGLKLGRFSIVNKLVLDMNGTKTWIFHGDVFDVVMKNSKWLAKLGGKGYDLLILLNTFVNWISEKVHGGRLSFSKKIKSGVKSALKFIDDFEQTAIDIAGAKGYENVICGHIHQPAMRDTITLDGKKVCYMNSGDWVENMTSLEYANGEWTIYEFAKDPIAQNYETTDLISETTLEKADFAGSRLFQDLLAEFQMAGLTKN